MGEEEEEAAESYEEEERRAAEKHLRKQISLFKMLALSASGVVGFRAASSSGASASASAMHGSTTSIRRCVGGRRRRGARQQKKDVFCRSEALDSSAFKELLGSFDGSPAFSGKTEKNKGEAAEREEEKNPSTSSAESVAYLESMRKFSEKYAKSTDTYFCEDLEVTTAVIQGLAEHKAQLGAPLCPCRHYKDKEAEAAQGFWNCPCVPMRERMECHCMLFLTEDNPFRGDGAEIGMDQLRDLSGKQEG